MRTPAPGRRSQDDRRDRGRAGHPAPAVRRRLRRHLLPEGVRRARPDPGPRAGLQRGSPGLRHPRPGRRRRHHVRRVRRAPCSLHASPEFLHRHIPKILAGEELWVQFFSEPEAGSDLAGIRTRATRDGDRWILNGAKIWSSGAYYADYGMCLARTNWDVPKHRGLTWFAVPTTAPGVTVQPITEINGDAEFCQEFFDDVELVRRRRHRRGRPGLAGGADHAGVRAGRRRLGAARAQRNRRPGPRPGGAGPAGRPDQDPGGAPAHRPGPHQRLRPDPARRLASPPAAGRAQTAWTPAASPPTESWPPGRVRRSGAGSACRSAAPEALLWEQGDVDGMTLVAQLSQRPDHVHRRRVPTRCSATPSASGCSGLPREPSFDTNKPFTEVIRDARNWSGQVG